MQTSVLFALVLIVLLNELISSLLSSKGEQGKFRFFPYPPLSNPPIPLKRLLKRRRAFSVREERLLPGGEAVTVGD